MGTFLLLFDHYSCFCRALWGLHRRRRQTAAASQCERRVEKWDLTWKNDDFHQRKREIDWRVKRRRQSKSKSNPPIFSRDTQEQPATSKCAYFNFTLCWTAAAQVFSVLSWACWLTGAECAVYAKKKKSTMSCRNVRVINICLSETVREINIIIFFSLKHNWKANREILKSDRRHDVDESLAHGRATPARGWHPGNLEMCREKKKFFWFFSPF